MAQTEIVISAEHGDRPTVEGGVGRVELAECGGDSQPVSWTEGVEVIIHPTHGCSCMAHPPRGPRSVARETVLALVALGLAGGCRPQPAPPGRDGAVQVARVDIPVASTSSVTPSPRREERTERWTRAWSSEPVDAETLRAMMTEAAQPEGYSAGLALGRRAPATELSAIAGTLPPQQIDPFLRGLSGRTLGITMLPIAWRLRWQQDPPSVALATLLGKNAIAVDATEAPRSESLMLDGDLAHQVAGARSIQNASVPLPSVAALSALHPVAFPLAMRALSARGGVATDVWLNLIATIGARVHPSPRSWSGAWLSLMDAVPTTDPAVRGALLALEPVVTQVVVQPAGVLAAYRCAVALRLDRIDQGHRTETCATGTDGWRSLAALAERARPPLTPSLVAEQLRNVLVQGSSDPRVVEAVAQAAVLIPVGQARPLLLQIAENRDPGVLAALLEGLIGHLPHARALPPPVLDRLLGAPFELPEAPSLEARIHATELRRALGLPARETPSTVRALQMAARPDAGGSPASTLIAPEASAGTWVLETTAGTIRIALRADTAPEALRLLAATTREGTYRQTTFHRVVPGFVAQGGDPRGDGYGGTSRIIPTELSGERFERGAVGIALAGLDTGGTQFFITLTDSPHLDARYPYVGQVISGMNVADRLMTGDQIVSAAVIAP